MAFSIFSKVPLVPPQAYDLPVFKPGNIIADAINDLSQRLGEGYANSQRWGQTPFAIPIAAQEIGLGDAFTVFGSPTPSESGSARVGVSNAGRLLRGPDADDMLEVDFRLDSCSSNNVFNVGRNDIIYIDITVSNLIADSATCRKGNKSGPWDDYPEFASFDGTGEQTNLYIPLAIIEDVSSANPTRKGDFFLLPGCLGLYQLWKHGDIELQLTAYNAFAALMPTALPEAI